MTKDERILVTGITGFIGSELGRRLSKEYDVYGLVRTTSNKSKEIEVIKDYLNDIQVVYANLTDFVGIKKIVKEVSPHYIVHVGAFTAVRHSFDNPIESQEVNHLGTVNLVHSALELSSFKKFIFASTQEVYGWQEQRKPFKEDLPLNPASPYAVAKLAAEKYICMAGKAFGLPYIISRCCNTFGRKHNIGFITEYLITSMLQNKTPYVGTPDAVRDLMYVDDHINAYLTMIKSDIQGEVFNFGNSSETMMGELAEKIKEMIGYKGKIIHGWPPDYPWRPVAEDYLVVDASKAKNILGWSPQVSIEEGLKRSIQFWKKNLGL